GLLSLVAKGADDAPSQFVRTRHISAIDSAATSKIVERLSRCFLRFSANQPSPRSAKSSPTQARITKPSEMYSASSQRESDLDRNAMSEVAKIMLDHQ